MYENLQSFKFIQYFNVQVLISTRYFHIQISLSCKTPWYINLSYCQPIKRTPFSNLHSSPVDIISIQLKEHKLSKPTPLHRPSSQFLSFLHEPRSKNTVPIVASVHSKTRTRTEYNRTWNVFFQSSWLIGHVSFLIVAVTKVHGDTANRRESLETFRPVRSTRISHGFWFCKWNVVT